MKDHILEAAAQEIELQGTAFRMDDLAKRLSISKRTLYENFRSKNEIIEKILTEKIQNLYEQHKAVLEDPELDVREKLNLFFTVESKVFSSLNGTHMREVFNKMPFLIDTLLELAQADWQQLIEYLKKEQQAGHLKEIDLEVFILMLQGVLKTIVYDSKRDPKDCMIYLREAIHILLNGILVEREDKK